MPCRQLGHVPSLKANGAMTSSPFVDVRDLGADVLDDADELVADGAGGELGVAAVVPEVRAADAGQDDADDRVGGFLEAGIGPLAGFDPAGLVEDGCTHDTHCAPDRAIQRGPVRGVLAGHPNEVARGLPS